MKHTNPNAVVIALVAAAGMGAAALMPTPPHGADRGCHASSAGIGSPDPAQEITDAAAGVHRGSARRSPGKGDENVI
jgi:hypothetical protein